MNYTSYAPVTKATSALMSTTTNNNEGYFPTLPSTTSSTPSFFRVAPSTTGLSFLDPAPSSMISTTTIIDTTELSYDHQHPSTPGLWHTTTTSSSPSHPTSALSPPSNSQSHSAPSTDWLTPSHPLVHDPLDLLPSTSSMVIQHPDRLYLERGVAGFVCKLYDLEAPDDGQKYAHWCKYDGKDMFIIDCIPKFTETVLPKLFKHCKFASFVRQLNIYGFQRDTDARKSKDSKERETCRWYHTYFRPGRRDLFHLIRRKVPRHVRRKRSIPHAPTMPASKPKLLTASPMLQHLPVQVPSFPDDGSDHDHDEIISTAIPSTSDLTRRDPMPAIALQSPSVKLEITPPSSSSLLRPPSSTDFHLSPSSQPSQNPSPPLMTMTALDPSIRDDEFHHQLFRLQNEMAHMRHIFAAEMSMAKRQINVLQQRLDTLERPHL
ncbi:hypothetical protein DM01DRAFT_1129682 [Hesseltinella vesiculosa]|uniref:HSF-type DNA-binding domain-containing protein n=1 Tax=Hesseltinella vesiculosa TaxID=101127 RepID=A0A1X2GUU4_9FUNG|nr:hypothetical protein DM01DRAFT_1129682 [Hesseltinella vesiculosa]